MRPQLNLWGLEKDSCDIFSNTLSKRLRLRLKTSTTCDSSLVIDSLRRTFSTRLLDAGVQEHVISRLLGHKFDSSAEVGTAREVTLTTLENAMARLVFPAETLPLRR